MSGARACRSRSTVFVKGAASRQPEIQLRTRWLVNPGDLLPLNVLTQRLVSL